MQSEERLSISMGDALIFIYTWFYKCMWCTMISVFLLPRLYFTMYKVMNINIIAFNEEILHLYFEINEHVVNFFLKEKHWQLTTFTIPHDLKIYFFKYCYMCLCLLLKELEWYNKSSRWAPYILSQVYE